MHEQDDDADNGKEEIEWRILDIQEGNALIISKYAIEGMGYEKNDYIGVTWDNSRLRKWLNVDFYEEAFNNDEKPMILTALVTADPNPYFGAPTGNSTQRKKNF